MSRSTTQGSRPPVRQRILDAADELFYAEGIASTGVDAVLERAGVAIGSLYSHFGGKDGLVLAYLQAREDRWREVWDAEVERHDDQRERVLAVFDAQTRWLGTTRCDHGCAHASAIAQLGDGDPARDAALGHKRAVRMRLRGLVQQVDDCALLSPADLVELVDDLVLLHEGAMVALAVGHVADPVGRARRLAAALLDRPR